MVARAGVDAMVARGVADANRLGIGGWSYGTPYERLDGFIKSCARSNTCSIA